MRDEAPVVDEALRSAVGFGANDLERNRAGRLSLSQALRIVVAIVARGTVALLIFGYCAWLVWRSINADHTANLFGLLVVGSFAVLFPLLIGWPLERLALDLAAGRVQSIKGVVRRTETGGWRYRYYYFHLKGLRFSVSSAAFKALRPAKTYQVYYTPRSKRLLALESKEQ